MMENKNQNNPDPTKGPKNPDNTTTPKPDSTANGNQQGGDNGDSPSPNQPEKNIPVKKDDDNDATRPEPGVTDPKRVDPTRIDEPKTDPENK